MTSVDILIGNNLPLYREVLVTMFRVTCPGIVVQGVCHDDLDAEVARLRPCLVLCSDVSQAVMDHSYAWILLFPDQRDEAIVFVDGERKVLPHAGFSELLRAFNDVQSYCRFREKRFTHTGDVT
jgi:hypothetical protein